LALNGRCFAIGLPAAFHLQLCACRKTALDLLEWQKGTADSSRTDKPAVLDGPKYGSETLFRLSRPN